MYSQYQTSKKGSILFHCLRALYVMSTVVRAVDIAAFIVGVGNNSLHDNNIVSRYQISDARR